MDDKDIEFDNYVGSEGDEKDSPPKVGLGAFRGEIHYAYKNWKELEQNINSSAPRSQDKHERMGALLQCVVEQDCFTASCRLSEMGKAPPGHDYGQAIWDLCKEGLVSLSERDGDHVCLTSKAFGKIVEESIAMETRGRNTDIAMKKAAAQNLPLPPWLN